MPNMLPISRLTGFAWCVCLSVMFLPGKTAAQQEPMFTQFMYNKLAYNPAYAGHYESPTLTGVYRNQWMNIEGAPKMATLGYSQPAFANRVGFAVDLSHYTIGISRMVTIGFGYAYRVAFRRGYFSAGMRFSLRNYYQNWTDPRLNATIPIPNDNAIPLDARSKMLANLDFGAYYSAQKGSREKWYIGAGVQRLFRNNIDFSDFGSQEDISREVRHLHVMGGATIPISDETALIPQALIKYAFYAPPDADVNLSIMLYKKYFGGFTYRTGGDTNNLGESVDILLGMQATSNLFVSLSYDIGITRLSKFSAGSVEVLARWWFNPPEGVDGPATNPNL